MATMTTGEEARSGSRDDAPRRPEPRYVPLVIGVVGHRKLRHDGDEIAKLESSVRAVLQGLKDRHRATPLVLLSSLAEGADRLAARVALELGMWLVVPLPMPQADFEQTFRDDASIADFHALRDRAT